MEFVTTGDGSKTLFNAKIGECYHSKHGAVQESRHVFIKTGLDHYVQTTGVTDVGILEVGFGTGLNFLQTADFLRTKSVQVEYVGIEGFPLPLSTIAATGYEATVDPTVWASYLNAYEQALTENVRINEYLKLHIDHTLLMNFQSDRLFDIVYFDAFAAVHQPEMWNDAALGHIAQFVKPGGVFVTYAITGNLKRSMKALGFSIEKAPGAPGKREMLRATKL
ncbi:tRNA (5-methylaminomethyl-2-thiouridine)(34)-methyltransferase MnmD [Sphingobacterium siyangense]|uniref:tRNA (5-methylaminomethyl-2-thiouridine)(34)-methyltransferase MnmD n=1 Tax=Sphingobacterium TaxID=28453 RepID=UPI0009584E42|nr:MULTISPECIES: tRNA (5-methylaminomethyl-2-thiouridine)(34)-methyltransferase MnmD [Sphingobacterium]APU99208.1 tRNA (5-methylaminomethyl-2-thiouridylate)-methyltransferase [Sphingobacterium sp. B29]UQA74879.1 tRNA (5-methylaminomethyl-2-thiouridine)(34)-methyltransferase MnmD [Sphingobacterium siyangense]